MNAWSGFYIGYMFYICLCGHVVMIIWWCRVYVSLHSLVCNVYRLSCKAYWDTVMTISDNLQEFNGYARINLIHEQKWVDDSYVVATVSLRPCSYELYSSSLYSGLCGFYLYVTWTPGQAFTLAICSIFVYVVMLWWSSDGAEFTFLYIPWYATYIDCLVRHSETPSWHY